MADENEPRLTLDEIEEILAAEMKKREEAEFSLAELDAILGDSAEVVPQRRVRKDPHVDRTISGWFRAFHSFQRDCEVLLHDEARPRNKGACAIINDVAVCRICFLNERDKL